MYKSIHMLNKVPVKGSDKNQLLNEASALFQWGLSRGVGLNDVILNFNKEDGRGLFTTTSVPKDKVLVSVPLKDCVITYESLMKNSSYVKKCVPPPRSFIHSLLLSMGINESMLVEQVQLAVAVACERLNPGSEFLAYFNTLPHPAVDNERVLALHRDTLSRVERREYEAYLRAFVAVARGVEGHWRAGCDVPRPRVPVLDWALRTVLARQTPLPAAPPGGLGLVSHARLRAHQPPPALAPLLDAVRHSPVPNVRLEVAARPGPCAELQAIADIPPPHRTGPLLLTRPEPRFHLVPLWIPPHLNIEVGVG